MLAVMTGAVPWAVDSRGPGRGDLEAGSPRPARQDARQGQRRPGRQDSHDGLGQRVAPLRLERSGTSVLLARARALVVPGERRLLGITGPPAAGKSTLAEELVASLGTEAVLVPMDGFHLAEAELKRLGIHERKGAIDTFDAGGFVALARRLKDPAEPLVYAPVFRRDIEEAIAGAIAIPSSLPLVVIEGNYLLVDGGRGLPCGRCSMRSGTSNLTRSTASSGSSKGTWPSGGTRRLPGPERWGQTSATPG